MCLLENVILMVSDDLKEFFLNLICESCCYVRSIVKADVDHNYTWVIHQRGAGSGVLGLKFGGYILIL